MKIRELLIELKAEKDPITQYKYCCLIGLKALQQVRPQLETFKSSVVLQSLFHQPYLTDVLNPSNQTSSNNGLCYYLNQVERQLLDKKIYIKYEDYLNFLFALYANYSGDGNHPIRCELAEKQEGWDKATAADQTYWFYHAANRNMFGLSAYGQERWKVINWLAEILENELSSLQKNAIPVLPNQLELPDD